MTQNTIAHIKKCKICKDIIVVNTIRHVKIVLEVIVRSARNYCKKHVIRRRKI